MGGFIDIRFPKNISFGSSGGPGYSTSIITVRSGAESRNANWDYPRCEYDVSYGIKRHTDLIALIDMFHVAKGRAYSFRYWDPLDYKSCRKNETAAFTDQIIGAGDGETVSFQIYKTYDVTGVDGSTIYSRVRKITKTVKDTVLVGLDGLQQTSGWSVDDTTGVITFNAAPDDGTVVTAGYEFDVHARFNTDKISAILDNYHLGTIDVDIIEVK